MRQPCPPPKRLSEIPAKQLFRQAFPYFSHLVRKSFRNTAIYSHAETGYPAPFISIFIGKHL